MENHVAEVQAELQSYLSVKNINNLFIQIVENMLIEKPDNPISFIIEFLYKQFPEQASDASIKPPDALIKELRKDRAGKPEIDRFLSQLETKDDFDEDTYDDNIRDLPDVSKSVRHLNRRKGVSAEPVNPNQMLKAASKEEPKTEEVTNRLTQIIRGTSFLGHLNSAEQSSIVKCMVLMTKSEGEVIIRQGEEEGSSCNFFIIDSGTVDVYLNDELNTTTSSKSLTQQQQQTNNVSYGKKVMEYTTSDSFGELSIMHSTPRAATCIASSPKAKLWVISRLSLQAILTTSSIQTRSEHARFLKSIPILATLNDSEVNALSETMKQEEFDSGQVICLQGEIGDKFYIVSDGSCSCWQKNSMGKDQLVSNLQRGDYFGEIALLTSKPRQATVKASSIIIDQKIKLLSVEREAFHRTLGSLEDLLKRNMDLYNQIHASQI